MRPDFDNLAKLNSDTFFTLSEAAKLCGITAAGVRKWGLTGRLKLSKVGGRYFIRSEELKKVIEC